MSTLQNSCQHKVLCRTLVAQDKVGLISASRREKSVTLSRRAFHTQHELHLSPRPARPHGISSGTPEARERRSGVPERGSTRRPRLWSPRPGGHPARRPLTDHGRRGRPAAPGRIGPAVTCRAGRHPARARWRCSRPRVCGWLRRPPRCAPGTEGSGPPCSGQPRQLDSTPRLLPAGSPHFQPGPQHPSAAPHPRVSRADGVTERRKTALGRSCHRSHPCRQCLMTAI